LIISNIYHGNFINITNCHDGIGQLQFKIVLEEELQSKISFLHFTILPPETSIGFHKHEDSEEIYIILKGSGEVIVNDEKHIVVQGDVILNRKGSSHGLKNINRENLEILVIEGKF
jgi:mannose-6-phosphate isomerase-like protein (cupin superfamily)